MGTMTTFAPPRPEVTPGPVRQDTPGLSGHPALGAGQRWLAWLRRAVGRVELWYAGFALYAAGVALFTGSGEDHYWGIWACGGYGAAAVLSWRWSSRRGRVAALAAAAAGALAGPAAWLAVCGPATPDATVVSRAGVLLLHHGSPYLAGAQLAHGGFLAYNPYLPVMAVFGLPHALGLPGLAGDPRPWLAAATAGLLAAAFWTVGRSRGAAWAAAAFVLATPVMALSIAVGVTDGPIIALIILALALARRRSVWPAAVVLGIACAMKYTAWPALAVLAAMMYARDGARAASRFAALCVATATALAAALAPAALASRSGLAALAANTIGYPLGLTHTRSPAQSPLPGHLLATLGPAGHAAALALLTAAGLAIAVSLVARPPATVTAAAARIAIGLTLLFALCPATRFGYLDYPLALCGWLVMSDRALRLRLDVEVSVVGTDRHDEVMQEALKPGQPEGIWPWIAEPDRRIPGELVCAVGNREADAGQ